MEKIKQIQKYYTNSYTLVNPCPVVVDTYLRSINLLSISKGQRAKMEAPITLQEVQVANSTTEIGKSLQTRWFSGRFITKYSEFLAYRLKRVFQASVDFKMIPLS